MSISFDRVADRYDATRGFPPEIAPVIGRELLRQVRLRPGARVLEVGVGTGRIALPIITQAAGRVQYTGVDISPEMMAQLRARLPASHAIQLFQADATQLPFASEHFDAVIMVHVLHLVSSMHQAVAEAWRVVRPGGLFLHGYNSYANPGLLEELRDERWNNILTELGVVQSPRFNRHTETRALLQSAFRQPREVLLASWPQQNTPRKALEQLASRSWSATWNIPEPAFSESLRLLEAWAHEHFADLDQPITRTAEFKLEIYTK